MDGMNAIAIISNYLDTLRKRVLVDVDQNRQNGEYRPDDAAWAILALSASEKDSDILGSARTRLMKSQREDGRVPVSPDHPEAFWPTPLAILAWHGSSQHQQSLDRAVRFLVRTAGRHFAKETIPVSYVGHDPSLRGWSWIADTHSMVEPTALGILALVATGLRGHPRTHEAVRMLMDRQLPSGGWNYGNTISYGQELYPHPENTGLALNAVAGFVPPEEVRHSLAYLESQAEKIRTPLSLGWAVLGLEAWGRRSCKARSRILECLKRQDQVGPYNTSNLSLLLISFASTSGLSSVFVKEAEPRL
jgi:hypothetical protein